VRIILK